MEKLKNINFWKRLQLFIHNVGVNDAMSMEEKEMIMRIAKEYEITSKLIVKDSTPSNDDIANWANSLQEKSDLTAKGTRIIIQGRCEGAKWMRDLLSNNVQCMSCEKQIEYKSRIVNCAECSGR